MVPFDLKTTECNGLAMVTVRGDLDCATAPRLRAALEGLDTVRRTVRIDLSATDFMDCAGVGVLVVSHRRLRHVGGELVLESPTDPVRRVLELTGVLDVIAVVAGAD
jgi:stage II sporulation protein AA (anti-sigma F factor antagonist)